MKNRLSLPSMQIFCTSKIIPQKYCKKMRKERKGKAEAEYERKKSKGEDEEKAKVWFLWTKRQRNFIH